MTGPVQQNFRGARALLVMPPDAVRDGLAATLRRLGLLVAVAEPDGAEALSPDHAACDVVFFDADQGLGSVFGAAPPPAAPYIAVIGMETPGRLARVVRQRCAGYLMKPVRANGVFTALFLAFNEFAQRRRDQAERAQLEQRLMARRFVTKAVLGIMEETGVDDDEAFRALRTESMRRRVSIETVARERLDASAPPRQGPISA